jgi:hypothetical protein
VHGGRVWVDPRPNEPGTPVDPSIVESPATGPC